MAGFAVAQTPPQLQGTFVQSGPSTCVPTVLGVLADTSDITPLSAAKISSRIASFCNLTVTSGLNVIEGVWALVRGVLNQTGGTTGGRNITITIGGGSSAHTRTLNLTNGSVVHLVFTGMTLNATSINATLSGSGSVSSGSSSGGSGGCGGCGNPVGIGYKAKGSSMGHAVIIISIDLNEPSSRSFGPGGTHIAYPVVYWDPLTNRYTTGWISANGEHFDDGITIGKVGNSVGMK